MNYQIISTPCYEDAITNLNYLQASIFMDHPELYTNYISWAAVMLRHRNIPDFNIQKILFFINKAIEEFLGPDVLAIVAPFIARAIEKKRTNKSMLACCVAGDHHEIGIRMVTDFFEMAGWETYYLGGNMPDLQLIEALEEFKPDILALSITLPSHVSAAAALISQINTLFGNSIRIIVGGYPFQINPGLWQKMGADGFADSASNAS